MRKNKASTRITSLLLVVLMLTMLAPSPAVFADEKPMLTLSDQVPGEFGAVPERISGANRYDTAVAISQESWTSSEYVLLATGEGWADALIANPLASALGAPILLTPTDYLHASVWAEIARLGATKIIILGGEGVVSQQVVTDLVSNGIPAGNIERLGGRDRYDTAARVAERVMIHAGQPQQVVVATGESYPDALAIAGYAARNGYPILLTRPGSLPAATSREIDMINPQSAVVVGGQGAVSDTVASRLPEPTRIGGTNRYDTAAQIAEYAFRNGMTYETVILATGEGYADALAAGPWVAKTQGMLALTATAELSTETDEFFNSHCTSIEEIYVAGGPGAVEDDVVDAVQEAAGTKMNADEIEVVSPAAESALETISPDGTLTFDDTVDYSSINTSDVILGKPSAGAPNGYLRRVVSVTEAGGKVSVETTLATLADVILKGSIDVTGSVPTEQPETQGALSVTDAEAVDATHVDVNFDSMQMQAARVDPEVRIGHAFFSYDRNFYENNGMTIRGEGWVDFTADFNIHANFGIVQWHKAWWGWWPEYGLLEFSAVAYVRETMVVHLLSQLQMIDYENEIELPKINLPTVTVWAGPVPIVFVNSITPVLGVSASAQANLDVGIGQWAGCSLGVYYNRWSGWHPVQSFWSGYNFTVAGAVEANAKAWIGARLDIMLYGAAGPYFQPQAFLEFDASTAANPWWTFDAGLEVEYGGRIDILGRQANVGWAWELARARLGNAPGAFPSSREGAPGDFSASGTVQPSGDVVEGMPMANVTPAAQEHVMPAISSSIVPESVEASDFTIDGLTVTDATVVDADTVRLTTTAQTEDTEYVVSVTDGAIVSDDGAASVSSGAAFDSYTPYGVTSVTAADRTHVDVEFSPGSTLETATIDASDFSIDGLTVTDAVLQADQKTVRLTTSDHTSLKRYRLVCAADAISDVDSGWGNRPIDHGFLGRWKIARMDSGIDYYLMADEENKLWAWGMNDYGQVGDGTTVNREGAPFRVPVDGPFRDVECGFWSSFAIRDDGTMWAWGRNTDDQLGLGPAAGDPVTTPSQVGAGIDWVDVENIWGTTIGLDSSGNAYTWGYGALGLGSLTSSEDTPQLLMTDVASIGSGKTHSTLIKTDGTLWSYGDNPTGAIHADKADRLTPVQMGTDTDWVQVIPSGYGNMVRNSSNQLSYGGRNDHGQAGLGDYVEHVWENAVPVVTDATDVAVSYYGYLAQRADGTLWSWGDQQGDSPASDDSPTPRQLTAETGWVELDGGVTEFLARKADGQPWVWENRWTAPVDMFTTFEYRPEVEYAAPTDDTHVDVVFDTRSSDLDASTVASGDFSITGVTVSDAAVQPDGVTVRLTTTEQTAGDELTLLVADGAVADEDGLACENASAGFTGHATYSVSGTSISPTNQSIQTILGWDETLAYGCGMTGETFKTTDGGSNWVDTGGNLAGNAYNMAFPDPSNSQLVMTSGFGGHLSRSTNGGTTWADLNLSAYMSHVDDINFAGSTGRGIAADNANMMLSTDYGVSWTEHPQEGTFNAQRVVFANDTRGYIGSTSGGVWQSDDAGATWTQLSTPVTAESFQDIWTDAADPDHVVAVGSNGYILTSFDGGETWTTPASGTTEDLAELSFASQDLGFACGTNGVVLVTRDGGRSWSTIRAAGGGSYLSGLWARDALNIWTGGVSGFALKVTGS